MGRPLLTFDHPKRDHRRHNNCRIPALFSRLNYSTMISSISVDCCRRFGCWEIIWADSAGHLVIERCGDCYRYTNYKWWFTPSIDAHWFGYLAMDEWTQCKWNWEWISIDRNGSVCLVVNICVHTFVGVNVGTFLCDRRTINSVLWLEAPTIGFEAIIY